MTEVAEARPLSAVDRVLAFRLNGDSVSALRLAASILTAAPDDLSAASLLARLLLDAGQPAAAGPTAGAVVDRAIDRGELPLAVVAAQIALEAGGFADDAMRRIASAFGKGSARLGASAPKPPTLPVANQVAPHFAQLEGPKLIQAAAQAAKRFVEHKVVLDPQGKVPELPLFSALEPRSLLELLGQLQLVERPQGAEIVRQGEAGRETFIVVRGVVDVLRDDGQGEPTQLASLGPSAIFGEMALVSDAPRAASARAGEPVQLLSVTRAALEKLALADPAIGRELGRFCHERMLANLMRHSAILSSVEPGKRRELMAHFKGRQVTRGEPLVRQGEEVPSLYLIASGQVRVSSTDASGERTILAELGPGDVVGEISLVLRRPATADVVALSPALVLALSREEFQEAIREHPTLLRELYDIAVQRDEETRNIVAQQATDVSDIVLL